MRTGMAQAKSSLMRERNKGQAGMGGHGKNKPKLRQDKATRRKVRATRLAEAQVPGRPSAKNPRRANQKRNQREWHSERKLQVKKAQRVA
jgi:hypothetical protein